MSIQYIRENTLLKLSSDVKDNPDLVNQIYSCFLEAVKEERVSPSLVLKSLLIRKFNQPTPRELRNYVNRLDEDVTVDELSDKNIYGETYLHRAAIIGTARTIEILLRGGADIHLKEMHQFTALHFAASAANSEAIDVLLKAGANTHDVTVDNRTPLQLAARRGRIEAISKFIEKKMEPERLEKDFINEITSEFDVNAFCSFRDYLVPNEDASQLPFFVHMITKGIIVSCGTERSFFDLIHAYSCDGLVIRDINPRVKAYVDFNTLLLRVLNFEEYQDFLFTRPDRDDLCWLREKMCTAAMPWKLLEYYLKNLENFATIFYSVSHEWRYENGSDAETRGYYSNPDYFKKLSSYAREGKIVSTIGSINDLTFLNGWNISLVDVSNIHNYTYIDLNVSGNPWVLFTRFYWNDSYDAKCSKYFCYEHKPLTEAERTHFESLIKRICDHTKINDPYKAVSSVLNYGQYHDNCYFGHFVNQKSVQLLESSFNKLIGQKDG